MERHAEKTYRIPTVLTAEELLDKAFHRASKISIKGNWTLTGFWAQQFRNWAEQDTVRVTCFFPFPDLESDHECQFMIKNEKHVKYSREQLRVNGLYKLSVEIEEL